MNLATYDKSDYSGGLNSTASLREIAPNEATVLQNWDITYQGQLRRRNGLVRIGNAAILPITGAGAFIRDSGIDLLRVQGTSLEYFTGSTWSAIANTVTAGNLFWLENVQVLGRIYLCNQDNALKYWDRASTILNSSLITPTNGGNPVPHGNVMIWYNNYMFMLNNVNVGGTIYTEDIFWSSLGDPNSWNTTTDHTTVAGDGKLVTAVPLGNNLVLFKERSVQYLSGFSNASFSITPSASSYASLSEEVGCIAPRGACQVGNEVWFIDNQARIRRVLQTDFDAFRHDVISTKIQATLDGVNKEQLQQAVMWSWNNKVYCAVPNASDLTNSLVFVFDILASKRQTANSFSAAAEAWTTYTGWHSQFAITYPTNEAIDLYLADANGNIYKHTGIDDDGVAIDAVFEDCNTDYGAVEQYKTYKLGYISAEAGTGDTNVFIDSSIDTAPYINAGVLNLLATGSLVGPTGNARCGPTGNAIAGGRVQNELRFTYDQHGQIPYGKRIRHRITHNFVGQQPFVNQFTSHYKPRNLR